MGFYETGFIWLEIFLGVHVVRVLFDLVRFCLLAIVDALLKVVLYAVHLSNNALETDEFVC